MRDHVVAAGGNSEVLFWDRRTRKLLGTFQDAHAEEVTQVILPPPFPCSTMIPFVSHRMPCNDVLPAGRSNFTRNSRAHS